MKTLHKKLSNFLFIMNEILLKVQHLGTVEFSTLVLTRSISRAVMNWELSGCPPTLPGVFVPRSLIGIKAKVNDAVYLNENKKIILLDVKKKYFTVYHFVFENIFFTPNMYLLYSLNINNTMFPGNLHFHRTILTSDEDFFILMFTGMMSLLYLYG